MQAYLFNFLQSARGVRDFLVAKGPMTIRSAADALQYLEDGARRAADYIEQFGPLVQFQLGHGDQYSGGIDGEQAQAYIKELTAIRDEAAAQLQQCTDDTSAHHDMLQKQLSVNVSAGLLDWAGKIDPQLKSVLWGGLLSLVTKVLIKSGVAAIGLAPKKDEAAKPVVTHKK